MLATGAPAKEFVVRITSIDYYMVRPHPLLDSTHSRVAAGPGGTPLPLSMVPVIRVFGATPRGQRSCLHIHQVFPYCYIPYLEEWHGGMDPANDGNGVGRLVQQLVGALDEVLGTNTASSAAASSSASAGGPRQHVRSSNIVSIEVVCGIPMYGYSPYQRYFLKLVFSHPGKVATAAAALQAGGVMGRPLPLYEAHIPLVLQFMTDYGVGGCDLLRARIEQKNVNSIAVSGVVFRYPLPAPPPPSTKHQDSQEASAIMAAAGPQWVSGCGWNVMLSDERLQRQSRCPLEADIVAPQDLLSNPQTIPRHAFSLPETNEQQNHTATRQRLVQSLQSIWQQSGEGSQSAVPLGHILHTQPGSQSREPQPPSAEEAAMQDQVRGMIAREAATAMNAAAVEDEAARRRRSEAAEEVARSTPIAVMSSQPISDTGEEELEQPQQTPSWPSQRSSSQGDSPELLSSVEEQTKTSSRNRNSSSNYAWTPFVDALLCMSTQRQSDGAETGGEDRNGGTGAAFSAAEARASLWGGASRAARRDLQRQAAEVDAQDIDDATRASTVNTQELEELLDWVQTQREPAVPKRQSSLLGLGGPAIWGNCRAAVVADAAATISETETDLEDEDKEDRIVDAQGWTQAEREEEAGIMGSQLPAFDANYRSDGDDEGHKSLTAAVAEAPAAARGLELPQMDGTDDRRQLAGDDSGDSSGGLDVVAGIGTSSRHRVVKRRRATSTTSATALRSGGIPQSMNRSDHFNERVARSSFSSSFSSSAGASYVVRGGSGTSSMKRPPPSPPSVENADGARRKLRTSKGKPSKNDATVSEAATGSANLASPQHRDQKRHRGSHHERSGEHSRTSGKHHRGRHRSSRHRSRSHEIRSASSSSRRSPAQQSGRSHHRSSRSSRRTKALPLFTGATTTSAATKRHALNVVVTGSSSSARSTGSIALSLPSASNLSLPKPPESSEGHRGECGEHEKLEDLALRFELSAEDAGATSGSPSQLAMPLSPSLSQPGVNDDAAGANTNEDEPQQHKNDSQQKAQPVATGYLSEDSQAQSLSISSPILADMDKNVDSSAAAYDGHAGEVKAMRQASPSSDESETFDNLGEAVLQPQFRDLRIRPVTSEGKEEQAEEQEAGEEEQQQQQQQQQQQHLAQQGAVAAAHHNDEEEEEKEEEEEDHSGVNSDGDGAAEIVNNDLGFAAAFEQLASHLPVAGGDGESRRLAFRKEMLAQLASGMWVKSVAAAPPALQQAFHQVQTAFDEAVVVRAFRPLPPSNRARSIDSGSGNSDGGGTSEPPFTFRVTPSDSSGSGSAVNPDRDRTDSRRFGGGQNRVFVPSQSPPTVEELLASTPMEYQEPYYSNPADRHRFNFGGQVFHPLSKDLASLQEFESSMHSAVVGARPATDEVSDKRLAYVLTPALPPPSVEYCERELRSIERRRRRRGQPASAFAKRGERHTTLDNAGREVLAVESQGGRMESQSSSGGSSLRSDAPHGSPRHLDEAASESDDEMIAHPPADEEDCDGYVDAIDKDVDESDEYDAHDRASRGNRTDRWADDDLGVVCSPRYDEGMGFAEMQGASATTGNSLARLLPVTGRSGGQPRQPQQQQPVEPIDRDDGSTPDCTPEMQQISPALSSVTQSGRRKSVQFGKHVREVALSAPTVAAGASPSSLLDDSPAVIASSDSLGDCTAANDSSGGSNNSSGPTMTARDNHISQLSMATRSTNHESQSAGGFQHEVSSLHGVQHFVIMSLEVHVQTRAQLLPDPHADCVTAICYCIRHETQQQQQGAAYKDPVGCLVVSPSEEELSRCWWPKPDWEMEIVPDEAALFHALIACIRRWDPDFILGYELEQSSLGFLVQRALAMQRDGLLDPPITPDLEGALSRLSDLALDEQQQFFQRKPAGTEQPKTQNQRSAQQYMVNAGSALRIIGRHCLNLWRILRGEIKLNAYAAEHVALHVLSRQLPQVRHNELTAWFGDPRLRGRALSYCMLRTRLNLQLTDKLDLIGRTAELARVFGIDFYSVLTRGSQFRVESIMLRLCHRHEPPFLASSPSKHQVAAQRALEVIPLVMEPSSRIYVNPVLVLDFRSLYPSVIIAYNLCYSTCLGQLLKGGGGGCGGQQGQASHQGPAQGTSAATGAAGMGATSTAKRLGAFDDYQLPPGVLGALQETLTLSPNEVMFTKPSVRRGILPRMLTEILEARIQVKKDLKAAEQAGDGVLRRILNAKQFALKLVANVTYGYTSASFSGRMPCVDLADAIVGFGRETLERCIRQIESHDEGAHPNWAGAKVQYGDTDSVFVELPGRTREAAFQIGAEIVQAVNRVNPRPVELELEKVYHPCILITKKRYVGYSWTSPKSTAPEFDAKGIETVRRDSCPLVAKMVEKCIRLLFDTKDLSRVKRYCQRQWARLHLERVSMADLIFRKEVRLGTYRDGGPAAALVAAKAMALDRMAAPRHGERVPYVVVFGEPGAPLKACCFPPSAVLAHGSPLRLNYLYYINRQINPSLARILNLVGADPSQWYESMPRQYHSPLTTLRGKQTIGCSGLLQAQPRNRNRTLDSYYQSRGCVLCFELHRPGGGGTGASLQEWYCAKCSSDPQRLQFLTQSRLTALQRQQAHLRKICQSCCAAASLGPPVVGRAVSEQCISLDCAVMYERVKLVRYLESLETVAKDEARRAEKVAARAAARHQLPPKLSINSF